jgi:hypothetical protein
MGPTAVMAMRANSFSAKLECRSRRPISPCVILIGHTSQRSWGRGLNSCCHPSRLLGFHRLCASPAIKIEKKEGSHFDCPVALQTHLSFSSSPLWFLFFRRNPFMVGEKRPREEPSEEPAEERVFLGPPYLHVDLMQYG